MQHLSFFVFEKYILDNFIYISFKSNSSKYSRVAFSAITGHVHMHSLTVARRLYPQHKTPNELLNSVRVN